MIKRILILFFSPFVIITAAGNDTLTIISDLPVINGYYYSNTQTLRFGNISGTYDAALDHSITINGHLAFIEAASGIWRIADDDSIQLNPGINRIRIDAFPGQNGTGTTLGGGNIDIWYDRDAFSQLGGQLNNNTNLSALNGPWHITSDITVPTGVTLKIEAGTTLFFNNGSRITIQDGGTLQVLGEQYNMSYLTKNPEGSARWRGIRFEQSQQENLLVYVVMTFGDSSSQIIGVNQSKLTIEHMNWDESTDKTVLELDHPSVIVRHSVFPYTDGVESVHGTGLTGEEYLVLDHNVFHPATGYNDVIDFSNCKRPGPIIELYNNTFLGGSDDGLDLDGCDAHIEGNIFQNFHKEHDGSSTSNAIATGEYNGRTSDIVVVRNIFKDNDHAVLLKEACYMEAVNNVFADAVEAAINFDEPGRDVTSGKGAYLDGNIFFQNNDVFANQFAPEGETDPEIIVNRCIIDSEFHPLGINNLDTNPQFVDPQQGDYRIEESSPARGNGPNGLDMGAYVPAGVSISGEPPAVTAGNSAVLTINGPGIVSYRYSINDTLGGLSAEYSVMEQPQITLENLVNGQTYTVYATGKNSAGRWQWAPVYTASKSWTVDIAAGVGESEIRSPARLTLTGYPNPFNPEIKITFTLPEKGDLTLSIYTITGQKVTTLITGFKNEGSHFSIWNGTDHQGIPVVSGTYIVVLRSGSHLVAKKITLIR